MITRASLTNEFLTPQIQKIQDALSQLAKDDFLSTQGVQIGLQKKGIVSSVLKQKRYHDYPDAFILGVIVEGTTVAIKIHEDCFQNCKKIYDDSQALQSLVAAGDIPPILSTSCIHGYRNVLYLWQEGENPMSYLDRNGASGVRLLTHSLQTRIESLYATKYGLRGVDDVFAYPEEDEFLCSPTGQIIVLDCNQIMPITGALPDTYSLAERIVHAWISRRDQS